MENVDQKKETWSQRNTTKILWVLFIIFLVATIVVFIIPSDSINWATQVLAACLGAVITILATRLLLDKQSSIQKQNRIDEDNTKRDQELYNRKLDAYSVFISKMYEIYKDNEISPEELRDLRTHLFSVSFYAKPESLEEIHAKMNEISFIDPKVPRLFAEITAILQNDLRDTENTELPQINENLWKKFQQSIDAMEPIENNDYDNDNNPPIKSEKTTVQENKQEEEEEPQRLQKQAWHFNAWGDQQFKLIEENLAKSKEIELSLVEYGEYWRTNLLKQVGKGDIIMLFRRGGYGYVGAFEAIGRRVFDFEKGEEEILYFNEPEKPSIVTTKDNNDAFEADAKKYDIYESKKDGATLCSNLIVKCIAYVSDGVRNPGGVYRRTISRYDSHYAWLLKERFQKKGQWVE